MYYVYLIRSINSPDKIYVGYTLNIKNRVTTHNYGGSIHTSKYKPWKLVMYMCFADEVKAREFEYYLKSQSGRAFIQKRLIYD